MKTFNASAFSHTLPFKPYFPQPSTKQKPAYTVLDAEDDEDDEDDEDISNNDLTRRKKK